MTDQDTERYRRIPLLIWRVRQTCLPVGSLFQSGSCHRGRAHFLTSTLPTGATGTLSFLIAVTLKFGTQHYCIMNPSANFMHMQHLQTFPHLELCHSMVTLRGARECDTKLAMCDTGELAIHGVTVQLHGGAGESKLYTVSHCHTAAAPW